MVNPECASAVPILRHRNWHYLLKDLLSSAYGRQLYGISAREIGLALLAPAAAARAITTLAPELLLRNRLTILIAGAEFSDAVDDGQWYQLLGWMLGKLDLGIDVTLVGLELDEPKDVPPWAREHLKVRPGILKPARKYPLHIDEFLKLEPGRFDLVCLFNPGLAGHGEWYEEDVLRRLFSSGDVVIGSSFGPTEVPDDRFMANLFGIEQVGETQENPFSIRKLPDAPGLRQEIADRIGDTDWGCSLWRMAISSDNISPHAPVFIEGVKTLDMNIAAAKYEDGLHGMDHVTEQLRYAGAMLPGDKVPELPNFPRGHGAIMSLRNHLIDVETGQFYDLQTGAMCPDAVVPQDLMAAYPHAAMEDCHTVPLALWSITVWSRCMGGNVDRADQSDGGNEIDIEYVHSVMKAVHSDPAMRAGIGEVLQRLIGDEYSSEMAEQLKEAVLGKERRLVKLEEVPVIEAYHHRDFAEALRLIDHDPRLIDAMDVDWTTGLYQAVAGDNHEAAWALLERGAATEHRDGEGWTPLMYAAYHNALGVMEALLEYDADVNAQSPLGFTPLHFAVTQGAHAAAMLLLDNGASVDIQCSAGYTVRDAASTAPAGDLRDRVLATSNDG